MRMSGWILNSTLASVRRTRSQALEDLDICNAYLKGVHKSKEFLHFLPRRLTVRVALAETMACSGGACGKSSTIECAHICTGSPGSGASPEGLQLQGQVSALTVFELLFRCPWRCDGAIASRSRQRVEDVLRMARGGEKIWRK